MFLSEEPGIIFSSPSIVIVFVLVSAAIFILSFTFSSFKVSSWSLGALILISSSFISISVAKAITRFLSSRIWSSVFFFNNSLFWTDSSFVAKISSVLSL